MKNEYGFEISEDDVVMLEALVRSPAFGALKRMLGSYRQQCQSHLLTTKNPPKLFEIQGRIIGINVIENLPGILVARRQSRLEAEQAEHELQSRRRKVRENLLGKSK